MLLTRRKLHDLLLIVPYVAGETLKRLLHHSSSSPELAEVICAVPLLMQLLVRQSAGVLSSCSQQLKYLVHNYTQPISLPSVDALDQLVRGEWPQLAVVVVNSHLGSSFEWPHSGTLDLCATTELSQGSAHSTACIVRSKQHGAQLQPPLQESHLSTANRFVSNIDQLIVSQSRSLTSKL